MVSDAASATETEPLDLPPVDSPTGLALGGILAAAMAYGLIVVLVFDVFYLWANAGNWPSGVRFVVEIVLGLAVSLGALCAVVFVPVLLIALLLLGVASLVAGLLRMNDTGHWPYFAAFAGGATGGVVTTPYIAGVLMAIGPEWFYPALALGPGIATVFGQVGGCYWLLSDEDQQAAARARLALQFDVRHLLVATAWLALLLALLKLLGIATVVGALVVWSAYQAGTLPLAVRMVRWRWGWKGE